jgi:F-type H+-transporting ATPase subunit epsilon
MAGKLSCEVVTAERVVFRGEVDMVIAPGAEGQMGILPRHVSLLAALQEGELILRGAGAAEEDISIAIGGGFIEVLQNRVVVLADSAERAEEIDVERAEAARKRALEDLKSYKGKPDLAAVEAALRRSQARLKVARRRRPSRGGAERAGGGPD